VLTAVMARVVLKKVPSTQQLLGIAVVSCGLVQRGYITLANSGGSQVCNSEYQFRPVIFRPGRVGGGLKARAFTPPA
jgi:hypothetical protein